MFPSARGARRLLVATALSLGLAGACDLTTDVPLSDDDFELPAALDDGGAVDDEEDPLDAGDEPAGDDGGRDAGDDRT